MRKVYLLLASIMLVATSCDKNDIADEAVLKSFNVKKSSGTKMCTTIQSATLMYNSEHYLADEALSPGYDIFGYNYQAHMFNGSYADAYLGRAGSAFPPYNGDDESYLSENPDAESHWVWPYRKINLIMKWNDAWLSNKDCDGDGKLDRHFGFDSYIGSGAWLTNHEKGHYIDDDGVERTYTYFVKIVAAPSDAYVVDGIWYSADDTEIGPVIWESFAIIQEQATGDMSDVVETYRSKFKTGLGNW